MSAAEDLLDTEQAAAFLRYKTASGIRSAMHRGATKLRRSSSST